MPRQKNQQTPAYLKIPPAERQKRIAILSEIMNISYEELAGIMLSLQRLGCSNINLVSPTPYLYHIAAALDHAASAGLHLPVVYNCGCCSNNLSG